MRLTGLAVLFLMATLPVVLADAPPRETPLAGSPPLSGPEAAEAAGTKAAAKSTPEPEYDDDLHYDEIKKPWDFAPEERVISPRKAEDYRKKGTILATLRTRFPQMSEEELREKKLALYDGGSFINQLPERVRSAKLVKRGSAGSSPIEGEKSEARTRLWIPLVVVVAGLFAVFIWQEKRLRPAGRPVEKIRPRRSKNSPRGF